MSPPCTHTGKNVVLLPMEAERIAEDLETDMMNELNEESLMQTTRLKEPSIFSTGKGIPPLGTKIERRFPGFPHVSSTISNNAIRFHYTESIRDIPACPDRWQAVHD